MHVLNVRKKLTVRLRVYSYNISHYQCINEKKVVSSRRWREEEAGKEGDRKFTANLAYTCRKVLLMLETKLPPENVECPQYLLSQSLARGDK